MQPNPFSREALLATLRAQSTGRAVLANPASAAVPGLPHALPQQLAHPALGLTTLAHPQPSLANLAALSAAVQIQAQAAAAMPAPVQSADAAVKAAEEAAQAVRMQRLKEEKAQKEAEKMQKDADFKATEEKLRCHLHKKPNNKCKMCQKHKEFLEKGKEEKAAVKEKFASALRGDRKLDSDGSRNSGFRVLEIADTKRFGFPPLLQTQLVESQYYKTVMLMDSMEQVVDELYTYADTVEPYAPHSVQAPSALFVCVYRLFTLGIDGRQLKRLLDNDDSPFVRCAGFLFVRYGVAPTDLWPWLGEYVLDEEDFQGKIKDAEWGSTVGEFVENLLSQDSYYKTPLPRLPVSTKRQLEGKLAQVSQYRKRARANRRQLRIFRETGVRVEAIPNDADWLPGQTVALLEDNPLRLRVRIKFDDGQEQVVAIGKVILAEDRGTSQRSRSRSRSPGSGSAAASAGGIDWSRDKGRSTAELLEDIRSRDRDKAVCTSGKDYSQRRVNSFQIAMPLEQGNNSHGLAREETAHTNKSRGARERSRSREADRKKENSAEHQAKMKALFEKYGMQKPTQSTKQTNDIERPDVMRLG